VWICERSECQSHLCGISPVTDSRQVATAAVGPHYDPSFVDWMADGGWKPGRKGALEANRSAHLCQFWRIRVISLTFGECGLE
jgi:hypothetical protein